MALERSKNQYLNKCTIEAKNGGQRAYKVTLYVQVMYIAHVNSLVHIGVPIKELY